MKPFIATATAAALLLSAPAFAATDGESAAPSGDIAAGEAAFAKQCVTCHVVKTDDGETLAGNRAVVGPNLYGITGGPVAAVEGFRYGKPMVEAGETDVIWDEENFVAYVQDPSDWLKTTLDTNKARSKMAWKVRDPQEAADLYAYLHDLAPYTGE
ncbi:c-type cytochrome [Roseovarius dicentrarchi]|uniref:c-type cytochrome n=1 Tax=Roseovarius dicentrarchi TaxID=2250573 RepID=UPI000DEA8C6B|nr:c-type cytochrome [Roseovarius dicentrarchi]